MARILNPDNYLSYLSPAEAFEFEVARNLYIAVLGATIWDILVYIPDDIKILRMQKGIRAVKICFVTSRLFALCYVLLSVLAKAMPLDNCNSMFIAIGCCCIASISSSSFLFLRRVQAVWANNRWVKGIFFVLWLIDGGLVVTVPVARYVIAGGIIPVIFDTFVFFAISYKIASAHSTIDAKVSWGTLVSGKALPRLSRAILQGGQQYYLITAGVYIILVILLELPSIPPIYRNMLAFPSASLTASMACRVYRNVKFLDLSAETLRLPVSDIKFARERPTLKNYHHTKPSFSTSTSPPMELRSCVGDIVAPSTTLDATSVTKSQSSWSDRAVDLRPPEPSLAYEARQKPDQ